MEEVDKRKGEDLDWIEDENHRGEPPKSSGFGKESLPRVLQEEKKKYSPMEDEEEENIIPSNFLKSEFKKKRVRLKIKNSKIKVFPANKNIFLETVEQRKALVFKGLKFYFVHCRELSNSSIKHLSRLLYKHGGKAVQVLDSCSHIVSSNLTYNEIVKKISVKNNISMEECDDIVSRKRVVSRDWLSLCFSKNRRTREFEYIISRTKIYTDEELISMKEKEEKENKKKVIKKSRFFGKASSSSLYYTTPKHRRDTFFQKEPIGMEDWDCINQDFIDELAKLRNIYKGLKEDFRTISYNNAIANIEKYKKRILSADQAFSDIHGVGKGIGEKIHELITYGKISKLEFLQHDDQTNFVIELCKVHGIGRKVANFYWNVGYRDINVVKEEGNWNHSQRIGWKYKDSTDRKIPRREAKEIGEVVISETTKICPTAEVLICGSYRRGNQECGDVDILIIDRNPSIPENVKSTGLLKKVVTRLENMKFMIETIIISTKPHKPMTDHFMGVCKLPNGIPRRIDIKVYARECYPFALLYFTGDCRYNRSMKLHSKQYNGKEYSLSDKALTVCVRDRHNKKLFKLEKVEGLRTERDVVRFLGLPWKEPTERNNSGIW